MRLIITDDDGTVIDSWDTADADSYYLIADVVNVVSGPAKIAFGELPKPEEM